MDGSVSAMKLPRIYPILDCGTLTKRDCSIERVAAAMLEGGAAILQFRHKAQWTRAVFETAEKVAALCREDGALFIVNDRADMAMLLDAGLHVGQDDLAPRDARRLIGPDRILGFSTHNAQQLSAAGGEPINYVAFGPIFSTTSKENPDPVAGLEQLRNARGLCDVPLVAIGGITRENAPAVFAAGADTVAVISDLLPQDSSAKAIRTRMEEWIKAGSKPAQ
jgi:thiamine-phosphate pyrophosphorylase